LDVGCGAGDWLRAFQDCGAEEVLGLDGDWVPESSLRIAPGSFQRIDLSRPLPSLGRFDLALCLEVAEHLEPEVGTSLVEWITTRADVVVWSAAIPGQGGHEHINERYQAYWMGLFAVKGFLAFDLIRPLIWFDDRVSWWYQQNLLVLVASEQAKRLALTPQPFAASLVHPCLLEKARDPRAYSLKGVARNLPFYVVDRLKLLWQRIVPHRA
jgi:hypothetical protein